MRKRHNVGRPCEAEVARTKFFKIRLTPAERAAIREMEATLADMIRKIARDRIAEAGDSDLPRAS